MMFEDGISVEIIASNSRLRRPPDSPVPSYDALIGRDILVNAIMTYDGLREMIMLQFGTPGSDESHSAG